jgi:hypothetical protein
VPVYRLRTTDGSTRPIAAGRVVVDGGDVRFQSPGTGGWVTVDRARVEQVSHLDRKVIEASGLVRWVAEREVNAAAAAARPPAPAIDAPPAWERPAAASPKPAAASRPDEPPAQVSARDVRCPRCGEQDRLSGRRVGADVHLTCDTCGYDGPRVAQRRCPTCDGTDVVERPKAVVERSRGTQLSVVGYTTVALCRTCDADVLAAALAHGGAVMPAELPTVDPQTLREMGRTQARRPDRGSR